MANEEEAGNLDQASDDMPLESPGLEELAAAEEPAEESSEAAPLEDESAVPDEDASEQPGEQDKATPEEMSDPKFKQGYFKGTQKWSKAAKEAQAEKDRLSAELEAARAQQELLTQQLAQRGQPKQEEDPAEAEAAGRLEKLLKRTPTYQALERDRAALRDVMASTPEAFVDESAVDSDVMKQIKPQLRQVISRMKEVDPGTIKTVAQALAAPVQAKLIQQYKAEKAALAQAKKTRAARMRQAQSQSSGGMGAEGTADVSELSQEQLQELMSSPDEWKRQLGQ